MNEFYITATDLEWINGEKDNPKDLCLHGHAVAKIGNEILEYDATVSATALYLLKTITEDHIMYEDNQMLPCCGHSMFLKEDGSGDVLICGCTNGIDWSVIHNKEDVKIITEFGNEIVISLDEYKKEVFKFADLIENFYNNCTEKILPKDTFERNVYIAFWKEWHRRRNCNNIL